MFAQLLEAIFGIREGKSWIDLDARMRSQLRFWGATSTVAAALLVILSLYFYVEWAPIKTLADFMWKDLHKSVDEKGEMPKWILRVGRWILAGLFLVALILFYSLVDFGKVHYRLDSVTLRIIPTVNQYIQCEMLHRLGCPAKSECALHEFVKTRVGARQFMNEVFYHFANRVKIATHNQEDKRRQVFAFWAKYYVFNYCMLMFLLACLWVSFLAVIKVATWLACVSVIAAIATAARWWWRGRYYRQGALDLAADQINAFFSHARDEVFAQAASLIRHCTCRACQVKTSALTAT